MNKQIPYISQANYRLQTYAVHLLRKRAQLEARHARTFLRLLEQQPCPMAQVNIDLEGGYAYLIPYCPERLKSSSS